MGLLDELGPLMAQFGATDDDKKAAFKQAMLVTGLLAMQGKKGDELGGLARAGLGGVGTYQNQLATIPENRVRQMQAAQGALSIKNSLQGMQDDTDYRKAMMDRMNPPAPPSQFGMGDRGAGPMPPPGPPPMPQGAPPQMPSSAPPQAPRLSQSKGSDYERAIADAQYLESKGVAPKYVEQAYAKAEKLRPKLKEQQTLTDPQSGQRVRVNVYEDGSIEKLPLGPDQEKAHFIDNGGKIMAADPFTGNIVKGGAVIDKTVDPNTQFSGNITMRGQNMTDARSREQNAMSREQGQWETNLDRGIQINKTTGATRPITTEGQPVGNALDQKRKQAGQTVNDVLDIAEPLIKKSTGSYYGTGVDKGLQVFGVATKGAESVAQLEALEGQLMLAQPRMEGPQSDKDTALYRQMAGRIADGTQPRSTRLAAVQTIRQLYKKYESANPSQKGATVDWSQLPK